MTSHQERKRRALVERLSLLERQWQAANEQLNATLNASDREPLKRQVAALDRQIEEVETELAALVSPPAPDAQKGLGAVGGNPRYFGEGRRWAVLVGVNQYDDYDALRLAVEDVTAVRNQLLKSGYDQRRVHLLTDEATEARALPTRNNLLTALRAVANATDEDDLLLFYYSGHGDAEDGQSYLVARDGRRAALSDTAVSLRRVEEILRSAKARGKIIVIDACRSGADIGSKGFSDEFIRRVFEQAEGLAILASCKQGELSWEDRNIGQGVFTSFLLDALTGAADRDGKGFVTAQDINRHVSDGVREWAAAKGTTQTPTFQSEMAGDIIIADLRPGENRQLKETA